MQACFASILRREQQSTTRSEAPGSSPIVKRCQVSTVDGSTTTSAPWRSLLALAHVSGDNLGPDRCSLATSLWLASIALGCAGVSMYRICHRSRRHGRKYVYTYSFLLFTHEMKYVHHALRKLAWTEHTHGQKVLQHRVSKRRTVNMVGAECRHLCVQIQQRGVQTTFKEEHARNNSCDRIPPGF